jgi:hypothetical protein
VFGTFYLVAIYVFVRGRDRIRLPSFIYTGMVVQTTFIVVATSPGQSHAVTSAR